MIVVLTFDHPHRKTQDLLFKLLATGVKPLVIATEWVERKNFTPIISHRPGNALNVELSAFCDNLGVDLIKTSKKNLFQELKAINKVDYILLATGNIIDEDIALDYKVINSHPGYLPDVKGLDALKWAIFHKEKIGVTTHFINEEIDGGLIIERKILPIHFEDTFHNVSYRQYELEVDMLVTSLTCSAENIKIEKSGRDTFRRMPHRLEYQMLEKFEELRKSQMKESK